MPALAAAPPSSPRFSDRTTSVVKVDEKSGHLVRSVAVEPRVITPISADRSEPASPEPVAAQALDIMSMIAAISSEQGVEEALVHSVIRAESNYNARAVSPKGAQGLMQLIPSTARRFGVSNALDVRQNVLGGVKYLKFLLDYYRNDYVRAIAAYNAGEAAVDKYNGVPPYPETRNYVYVVARNLKAAREQVASSVAATVAAVVPVVETYKRIEASVGSDGLTYYRTP
jgi:soluble lytic murein transglycosylase-like protein